LRVSPWGHAQFDNVSVVKTAPWPEFVPHSQMRAVATSEHTANAGGYTFEAANAIDDRPETAWSAEWEPPAPLPQSITLDLAAEQIICGLVCQLSPPRVVGNPRGNITGYRVNLSHDGKSFVQVGNGNWSPTTSAKWAAWPAQSARYVRLEATESSGVAPSVGELNIATTPLTGRP
jgi:hypothetical protein